MRRHVSPLLAVIASLWLLLLSGCATYSSSFKPIEREIIAQRPEAALKLLERQNLTGKDELLHLLNKAMLLRMMEKYEESNSYFQQAKQFIKRNSATSITENAASFLINDSTLAFIGDPFEQVFIHLYSALNYLQLNQIDSARVEALQVDIKLRQISSEKKSSLLNTDPFARYLSGIIFEDLHEWSDALIAYRKAYKAYQGHQKHYRTRVPSNLEKDLLRLSDYEGTRDEHDKYRKQFSIKNWLPQKELSQLGEVILFIHNGLAPIKKEHTVGQAAPQGRLIRISLPYYKLRKNGFGTAHIKAVNSKQSTRSELVENINQIALKTLQANMPEITARTLGRVIAKQATARKAEKQHAVAGLLLNVANFVTETADTRSWLTLPGEIHLARMPLKPGTYTIELDMLGHHGQSLSRQTFNNVAIKRGRKTYLNHHWVSPAAQRRK